MAILKVTPEAIRELLRLPADATVVGMQVPFDNPGIMEIKVEGAGWDTPEGGLIKRAEDVMVTKQDNGAINIDWGFPSDEDK
jgi:hypothetical protein